MITPLGIGRGAGDPEISALSEVGTLEGHWTARAGCLSVVSPRTEATDGQTVVRMEDQSGNARHMALTAGAAVYAATGGPSGAAAIYFDGDDYLQATMPATYRLAYFAVGRWTGAATFPGVSGLFADSAGCGVIGHPSTTRLNMGCVGLSSDPTFIGDWRVGWCVPTTTAATALRIGYRTAAGQFWTGYLCEAAAYGVTTPITIKQIRQVVRFLAASWGLTLTE